MQVLKSATALAVVALLGACLPSDNSSASRNGGTPLAQQVQQPEGYARVFSPAPHNYRKGLRETGDPVRYGAKSDRFELRNGDCGGGDCSGPRARAEIQLAATDHPARLNKDIWYGWSFYNASVPSFTKKNSLRLVFGQWSMGAPHRPIFRLIQLGKGEGNFNRCDPKVCAEPRGASGDLVVQLEDMAKTNNWGKRQNDGYVCRLFDLTKERGKWVDMTVNTNFSTGQDGYLRIWVNGRLACNYRGPLVSAASAAAGTQPIHRRGVFSSWDKRWRKAMGNKPKPTLIVYYDEFAVGTSAAAVDVPSRVASSARALD